MVLTCVQKRLPFICIVILCCLYNCVFAELQKDSLINKKDSTESTSAGLKPGFFFGAPSSFYGSMSALGLQVGYQYNHISFRFQFSASGNYANNTLETWSQLPSVSFMYSKTGFPFMKYYTGLTVGLHTGLYKSFHDKVVFLNLPNGVELFPVKKTAFFVEVGPGIAVQIKDGAFKGGTILEAGIRLYL